MRHSRRSACQERPHTGGFDRDLDRRFTRGRGHWAKRRIVPRPAGIVRKSPYLTGRPRTDRRAGLGSTRRETGLSAGSPVTCSTSWGSLVRAPYRPSEPTELRGNLALGSRPDPAQSETPASFAPMGGEMGLRGLGSGSALKARPSLSECRWPRVFSLLSSESTLLPDSGGEVSQRCSSCIGRLRKLFL